MIRFAKSNDICKIIRLWHECFGDSENEIKFFLDNNFIPENTLVFEDNGNIVSMLFLLDGKMHIANSDYPAYYLYAACTAQCSRGKGLMAKLLKYAEQTSKERGIDFICLMPAEKKLFNFYSKHGYISFFEKKELHIKKSDIKNYINKTAFECNSNSENLNLQLLRDNAFDSLNYFKWDNRAIEFAFEHTKFYSGNCFVTCEGYLLYNVDSSTVYVKESAFPSNSLLDSAVYLLNKYNADEIIYNLPVDFYSDACEFEINPSGMILPLNEENGILIQKTNKAYLGLTLD